jgi:glycosyltransferase involved in cell wall biosynthesis
MSEGVVIPDLVSTIIPVHDRPTYLAEAVASVLAQDHRPIEILIVDDGSRDPATPDLIRRLEREHPGVVFGFHQVNAGPGRARETGRRAARGSFLQYLDSDDLLLPGKFSAQVAALHRHPQAQVAYGFTFLRDRHGRVSDSPQRATGKEIPTMFPMFLNWRWWFTSTPLYRRTVCDEAGPWTDLRLEEDWEYDVRIASLGGRLVWCPLPVSEHRDHGQSRLSRGPLLDPGRLRDQATAQTLMLGHARRYGLRAHDPSMRTFARSLFLLARHCGAAGLSGESRRLTGLALSLAKEGGGRSLDIRLYQRIAALIGWNRAGAIGVWLHRFTPEGHTDEAT